MNVMRRTAAAAVTTLALGGGMAATASVASASASAAQTTASRPLPKIQTGTRQPAGWNRSWQVRPGYIYFGGGAGYSAPRIKDLHWSYYGQVSADARGRWFRDTCNPDCAAGGYWVNGNAYFYGVFNHRGPGRNFGNVNVTWTQRGHHYSMHLWIDSRGQWDWS